MCSIATVISLCCSCQATALRCSSDARIHHRWWFVQGLIHLKKGVGLQTSFYYLLCVPSRKVAIHFPTIFLLYWLRAFLGTNFFSQRAAIAEFTTFKLIFLRFNI